MENKEFDQIVRQQLEDREIKPSSMAWERLQNELEHPQLIGTKKRNRHLFWLVAAGFALIFGTMIWTFYPSDSIPVVTTPKNEVHPFPIQKPQSQQSLPVLEAQPSTEVATVHNDTQFKNSKSPLPVAETTHVKQEVQKDDNRLLTLNQRSILEEVNNEKPLSGESVALPNDYAITLQYEVPKIDIEINEKDLLHTVQGELHTKKSKKIKQIVIDKLKNKAEDIGIAIHN